MRKPDQMHERHRTGTPDEYRSWQTGSAPLRLAMEPVDRQARACAAYIADDAADGYRSSWSDVTDAIGNMPNSKIHEFQRALQSGDKLAIGVLLEREIRWHLVRVLDKARAKQVDAFTPEWLELAARTNAETIAEQQAEIQRLQARIAELEARA